MIQHFSFLYMRCERGPSSDESHENDSHMNYLYRGSEFRASDNSLATAYCLDWPI